MGPETGRVLNARPALLHAMEAPVDPHVADPTQGPYGDVQTLLQSRLEARLRTLVSSVAHESSDVREPVGVHLVPGPAKDAFFKLSREIPLDLIIVGVRQRSTIGKIIVGSTSEALLRNAPAAVLTVPLTESGRLSEDLSRERPACTAVVRDVRYLAHTSGGSHMESERRLTEIYSMLDHWPDHPDDGPPPGVIAPRAASLSELSLVHDPDYVSQIAATADSNLTMLTGDTFACARSYEAAALAAGGVIAAIDAVVRNDFKNAFVLCRPPGHHAEISRANGFCLFNNVAIGAQYARVVQGMAKVLIVDWDVHHGNGIQHMFEQDATVMYMSIHQYPPFSGYRALPGDGQGKRGGLYGQHTRGQRVRRRGVPLSVPGGTGAGSPIFQARFDSGRGRIRRPPQGSHEQDEADVCRVCRYDPHSHGDRRNLLPGQAGAGSGRRLSPQVLAHSVKAVLTELCDQTRTDPHRLAVRAKPRRVMPVLNRCRHVLAPHWPCLQPQNPSRRDHE